MGEILDTWLRCTRDQTQQRPSLSARPRRQRVIAIANNKGGVGKTTLALNLAVYLRKMREGLPVLVVDLDDQDLLGQALGSSGVASSATDVTTGSVSSLVGVGRYGVHYLPGSVARANLHGPDEADAVGRLVQRLAFDGWILLDTKSCLGSVERSAIASSDLVIVPVRDLPSLREAEKVISIAEAPGRQVVARVLLSMLDLRIKFEGAGGDILALLLRELRLRNHTHFATFLSRSQVIEALQTQPDGLPRTILHGAPRSKVHRQMYALAHEVLETVDALPQRTSAPVHALKPQLPKLERELKRVTRERDYLKATVTRAIDDLPDYPDGAKQDLEHDLAHATLETR